MAQKAAILASLAGSAVAVEWRLAAEGLTCNQACKCLGCVEGEWPTVQHEVGNVATKVGYECEAFKASDSVASPTYQSGGTCHFSATAASGPTCAAVPRAGERRLCPCADADQITFHLAKGKASCTEECLSFGATCVNKEVNPTADNVWPTSAEAFRGAYTNAGCTQFAASSSQLAPMKIGPMCYYPTEGSTTNCDAFGTDITEQRLCACQGVSACVMSSATQNLQAWVPPPPTAAPESTPAPPTTTAAPAEPAAVGVPVPPPTPTESGISCSNGWTTGGGAGGSKFKLTSTFHTAEACKAQVEQVCDGGSGATYSPDIGECWCEKGQVTVDRDPTLVNCEFSSVVSLGGGRLYEVHQESQQRGASEFMIVGAAASALAMLVGFTYRSRGAAPTTPLLE